MMSIEEKLWKLQQYCDRCKMTDPLADWVFYAVNRYIRTGRATRDFERAFCNYPEDKWPEMIKYCLNGNRSDNGIMEAMKRMLHQ